MIEMQQHVLEMVKRQRNFILLSLSNPADGQDDVYKAWFTGAFRDQVLAREEVLRARFYQADSVDITIGRFPALPMKHLAILDVSVDHAELAEPLIDALQTAHANEACANKDVATWLYYPASEKYGLDRGDALTTVAVHYTNPVVGREAEFYEWFVTRMVPHAPIFAPLVSGQRFERTLFQKPGALAADYQTVGLYDQLGPSEQLIESFQKPPTGPNFDALDVMRFTETSYLPLA